MWCVTRKPHAQVKLERAAHELRVCVQDDGKGFDAHQHLRGPRRAGRLGLLGMQERLALVKGHLEIESEPGGGTRLCARVPLPKT